MKCMKCGHGTYESTNTEAIELGSGCLLVIRNIPCFKCKECDDIFYTGDVVEKIENIISYAKTALAQELMVMDYSSAA